MDNSTHFILEHLKRFEAGQNRIEPELREIKGRMSQLEIGVASIRGDLARMSSDQVRQTLAVDALAQRIDRIERRLELTT